MLNLENRIWKYPSITEGLPMTRGKYDQLKLRRQLGRKLHLEPGLTG